MFLTTCPKIVFEVFKEIKNIIIAKKLILLLWKGKDTPSLKMWLTELTTTLHLEKIRYTMHDNMIDFEKIWQPLISYLEDV